MRQINIRTKVRQIIIITMMSWSCTSQAGTSDPIGVAGPALLFLAITNPLSTLQALSKIPDERRRTELFTMAWKQCDEEAKSLPEFFDIDSFIDDGAGLQTSLIFELLIKRRIKSIYIRPSPINNGQDFRLGIPDGSNERVWHISQSAVPNLNQAVYAKLELASLPSGACLPAYAMPSDASTRIGRAPMLPDTCLAVTYTDRPQARFALTYRPSAKVLETQFGYWSIVDLTSNSPIASLTTIDSPSSPGRGAGGRSDCRAPYSVLAWKIAPAAVQKSSMTVQEVKVQPSIRPSDIASRIGPLKLVTPVVTNLSHTKSEAKIRFSAEIYSEGWQLAVSEAKQNGWGHYGSSILDWEQLTLKELLANEDTKVYGRWAVATSDKGFFVFPDDWKRSEKNLLARYDASGSFEWAVEINRSWDRCSIRPLAVETTPTSIVLRAPCGDKEGVSWEISKKDIPYYERLRVSN